MENLQLLQKPRDQERETDTHCPLCGSSSTFNFLNAPDWFHGRKHVYHLTKCSHCEGVWLKNPPPPHEMGFHYGLDYHKSVSTAGETRAQSRWRKQRELICRFKRSGSILDVGCNSGGFLGTMKNDGWELHGIEMQSEMAERARLMTGGDIFTGDATDATFAPESFDVVTCFDVLEHMYNPIGLVRNVRTWLKAGGIFYVMLPNIDSFEARALGQYWYGLELPRHLFHFSPQSLGHALRAQGLNLKHLETSNTTYIEHSLRYVWGEMLGKLGIPTSPLATRKPAGLTTKALRKLVRLGLLGPVGHAAAFAKSGASIDAVFGRS